MNNEDDIAYWSWFDWMDSDYIDDSTFATMLYHESLGGAVVHGKWRFWIEPMMLM